MWTFSNHYLIIVSMLSGFSWFYTCQLFLSQRHEISFILKDDATISEEFRRRPKFSKTFRIVSLKFSRKWEKHNQSENSGKVLSFTHFIWTFRFSHCASRIYIFLESGQSVKDVITQTRSENLVRKCELAWDPGKFSTRRRESWRVLTVVYSGLTGWQYGPELAAAVSFYMQQELYSLRLLQNKYSMWLTN